MLSKYIHLSLFSGRITHSYVNDLISVTFLSQISPPKMGKVPKLRRKRKARVAFTLQLRTIAVKLRDEGFSFRRIGRILSVCPRAIMSVYSAYRMTGELVGPETPGRKPKITPLVSDLIVAPEETVIPCSFNVKDMLPSARGLSRSSIYRALKIAGYSEKNLLKVCVEPFYHSHAFFHRSLLIAIHHPQKLLAEPLL